MKVKRALISVSNKTGVVELGKVLADLALKSFRLAALCGFSKKLACLSLQYRT